MTTDRPRIEGLTEDEAARLAREFTNLLHTGEWQQWSAEELAYVALLAFTPRLLELFAIPEYERVRFSCDCGSTLDVTLGYPIPNRAALLTFIIDHGHAPKARGIALRKAN